ncbi:MAG: hypothetical protein WC763_02380 [Candidatus Paceibacterota bacterium]
MIAQTEFPCTGIATTRSDQIRTTRGNPGKSARKPHAGTVVDLGMPPVKQYRALLKSVWRNPV